MSGYAVPAGAPQARGPITPGDWRYQPAPGQLPYRSPPPRRSRLAPASPFTYSHVKVAPAELPRMFAEMGAFLAKRRRNHALLCVALAIVPACAMVIVPLGIILSVFLVIYYFARGKQLRRERAKLDFLIQLLDLLADELHPRMPVRFDFDLSAYDAKSKLVRTTRSLAGNAKTYHSDKWLRLQVILADRTALEIVRQQSFKTKKGNLQLEKRRLFVTVTPNRKRYRPMNGEPAANRLRAEMTHTITRGFHNHPEQVHFRVAHHIDDIALRVVQDDAEILPNEVMLIAHGVMHHLRERCLVAPAASR